jgi:hypothetical protein
MAQIQDHSGFQRELISAKSPHRSRKTKGKKIRLWMSHRVSDCLKSLLWRSTSRTTALIIKLIFLEKRLPTPFHSSLRAFLKRLRSLPPCKDPVSQTERLITKPAKKTIKARIVVVSPTEKVAA